MIIELAVQGAYSKGGIPLNVQGVANVKIAGEQPVLDNAIERFLGVDRAQDHGHRQGDARGQPARRAVDADARGGQRGQDQVRRSRCWPRPSTTCAARARARHAEDPARLRRHGLPRQHRPQAVGRGAEEGAASPRRAPRPSRRCRRPATCARPRSRRSTPQIATARAENARRLADAQTRAHGAGRRGPGPGRVASWRAPRASSRCRRRASSRCAASCRPTCWSRRARARPAAEAGAKGDAAQIIEQGRATAAAMAEIAATWREVGPPARSVFLMQKVDRPDAHRDEHGRRPQDRAADRAGRRRRRRGRQRPGPGWLDLTGKLIAASEQIKAATGIDLAAVLRGGRPERRRLAGDPFRQAR